MGICVCDCDMCKYLDDHCCISVNCNILSDDSDDEPYDDMDDDVEYGVFEEEGDR